MFQRTTRILASLGLTALLSLSGCNNSGNQSSNSSNSSSSTTSGAGTGGGASGSDAKKPRVAYVTNGVASFWVIAEAGAKAAGEKFNADVAVHMPAEGISEQKRIMEDLMTRGVDGIAISPIDPANQTPLIN